MEYSCSIDTRLSKFKLIAILLSSFFSLSMMAQPLSCVNEVNISLDNNCLSTLEPEDFLTPANPAGTYSLVLTTASGVIIPANQVDESYLWTKLTAKVTNAIGNSCWAYVNVEDKMGPVISSCADITISCIDMNSYEPTAVDACSGNSATVVITGNVPTDLSCDDNYVRSVLQSYEAIDSYGNKSECEQNITLRRLDFTTIEWPSNFEISTNTNLTCQDPMDADGYPAYSHTGVPKIEGVSVYPYADAFCNIAVDYQDDIVVDFGCSKKIMRTWYIYEWHCGETIERNRVQALEINDTEKPVLTDCVPSIIYDADGSVGCDRSVELILPTATDDCSGILEMDVSYQGGFANNAATNPVVMLTGSSVVTYTVYDQCDNSDSCNTLITIRDNESPTARCDNNAVVSLRADGTAIAYTATFDNNSFDDCELYKTVVRRANDDCGCDRPRFDDQTYLGDHNGHFYYLSDKGATGPWAEGLATGLGAELVSFETEEEADWVVNAALAIKDSIYLGLSDIGHPGRFLWPNDLPVVYKNWAAGQIDIDGTPLVAGSYVILNEDGEWEIVDGSDSFRYIIEVTNPCGFSDRIDFCCTDVGIQQAVVVRAIDASGRINECTSNVTVQDKVAPVIVCPADVTIACGVTFDPADVIYGLATATDQCTSDITNSITSNIDPTCDVGTISKIWTASDITGSSSCTQTFHVESMSGYDGAAIVWPLDYEVVGACDGDIFLPMDLPFLNGFPQYTEGVCDNISRTYSDDTYSFSGPASDACAKILRNWTVTDECMPLVAGINPRTYQQAIKIINETAPTIDNCDPRTFNTVNCESTTVDFIVTGTDDCMPTDLVTGTLLIDGDFDRTTTKTINSVGNVITFSESLPVGTHNAIISFSDRCGNTESCTKVIQVVNTTAPTVICKPSVSVNIQGMDLDRNPATADVNMAMVSPDILIESTSNPCGFTLTSSFSASDPNDIERIFDCADRNTTVALTIYVIDAFGFSGSCTGNVVIQDNNMLCGLLITNELSLSGCRNVSFEANFCTSEGPLTPFDITASSTACVSSGNFQYSANWDYGSDGNINFTESGIALDGYAYNRNTIPGTHLLTVTMTDECGASASCTKEVAVSCDEIVPGDLTGPVVTGCNTQAFTIADCNGEVIEFVLGVTTNSCLETGDNLMIAKIDFDSDGYIDIREDLSIIENYTYNFPTPVGSHIMELEVRDACGAIQTCTKELVVTCLDNRPVATITGRIETEDVVAIEEVEVTLDGAPVANEMTAGDGSYAFPEMNQGGEYVVRPFKDTDHLNGVSTLDLILIQRNILGIERLDSPYKLIAADIDKSGSLNGIDLIELRKLILGIYDEFPNNTSWRMVDASHQFLDYTNPFRDVIEEQYIIDRLDTDMVIDFIGVKVGDVNNSAQLAGRKTISSRSGDSYKVSCESKLLSKDAQEEIIFTAANDIAVHGFQMAISIDKEAAEILELIPMAHDMNSSNFNSRLLEEGIVMVSWNSSEALTKGTELFKVILNTTKDIRSSELITLLDSGFSQEAYETNKAIDLKLDFDVSDKLEEEIILFQNRPNPWSDMTEISFYLPSEQDIIVSIFNINGKLLYQEQKFAQQGLNKINLSKDDLPAGGVLYYELQAEDLRLVQKMIVID